MGHFSNVLFVIDQVHTVPQKTSGQHTRIRSIKPGLFTQQSYSSGNLISVFISIIRGESWHVCVKDIHANHHKGLLINEFQDR